MVVEHVEARRSAQREDRMLHLPVRVPDPLARRRLKDGLEARSGLRVAGREERDVVTRVDEPVREQRDDALGAAVRLGRDREPHWTYEADSHAQDLNPLARKSLKASASRPQRCCLMAVI